MALPKSLGLIIALAFCLLVTTAEANAEPSLVKAIDLVALSPRMEYLVDSVSGRLVMQYFMGRYPQATFTEHPTMNGFYVMGSREVMLAIKRELAKIEDSGEVPPVPTVSTIPLRNVKSEDAVKVLRQWVIGVQCQDGLGSVILEGDLESRHEAATALLQIDRPSVWLKVSREQLASCPGGACEAPPRNSDAPFTCPKGDCGGILHLTGLRQGDQIRWLEDTQPGRPFWVVTREGAVTNVYVEFY